MSPAIREPKFVVDHTIEYAPIFDAASSVAAVMVSELRVHAAANVDGVFLQTLIVLQMIRILDSGLLFSSLQVLGGR
ncbi:hypothetical protein TNCV_4366091 [Trichonephila clavipes]|nr:hypothetical protein TNCV_4366091 [Trichonephila clavipes]